MSLPVQIKRVQRSLDKMEYGGGTPDFSIDKCCDYIAWLARFHKVPEEVWQPMCEQATRILENKLI